MSMNLVLGSCLLLVYCSCVLSQETCPWQEYNVGQYHTSDSNFTFTSSFVQIFDWMSVKCDSSHVISVTFLNVGTPLEPLRFYLASFQRIITPVFFAFNLLDYIMVEIPDDTRNESNPNKLRTIELRNKSKLLYANRGNVLGIFYDSSDSSQYRLVVPYQEIFEGDQQGQYPTYVGRLGERQLSNVRQLRVGSDLNVVPKDRLIALQVTFSSVNATTTFTTTTPNNNNNTISPNGVTSSGSHSKRCSLTPPSIDNAFITFQSFESEIKIGDTLEYTCLQGYRFLIGDYYRVTCKEPMVWSELPVCVRDLRTKPLFTTTKQTPPQLTNPPPGEVTCFTSPGNIRNGHEAARTYRDIASPGDYVTFNCNPGYVFTRQNREARVFCQQNGTWTVAPACERFRTVCREPPKRPDNAILYTQTFPLGQLGAEGDEATYFCVTGYISSQDDSRFVKITCSQGEWDNKQPDCFPMATTTTTTKALPISTCGEPPNFAYAVVIRRTWEFGSKTVPGDYALYSCVAGYKPRGNGEARCMGDLRWSVDFLCIPDNASPNSTPSSKECGRAPTIEDAVIRFQNLADPLSNSGHVGDHVYYDCNSDYIMAGSPYVYCMADYRWSVRFRCIRQ